MRKTLLAVLCLSMPLAGASAQEAHQPHRKAGSTANATSTPSADAEREIGRDPAKQVFDRGDAISKRAIGSMCSDCLGKKDNAPASKPSMHPSEGPSTTTATPPREKPPGA